MHTVNFAYNDTRRGIKKVSLFAKCRYTRSSSSSSFYYFTRGVPTGYCLFTGNPKSHYMYYSGMGLCSGHGNSVVIRELSLYPQSLLAKLTVYEYYFINSDIWGWNG